MSILRPAPTPIETPLETIAILDFETTGEPVDQGGRATEIAIVLVRAGRIVDRYQSLMSTGAPITSFAQEITGITNDMLRFAPPARKVMSEALKFVGAYPLGAHNASFDSKFWDAEMARADRSYSRGGPFLCTMLLARRVYPNAPNHKLSTLASHLRITPSGRAHRAMVDADMTAHLLARIQESMMGKYLLTSAPHALLERAQRVSKDALPKIMPELATSMGLSRPPLAVLGEPAPK
jgi:DNA polymerase-3 subunit epsilon